MLLKTLCQIGSCCAVLAYAKLPFLAQNPVLCIDIKDIESCLMILYSINKCSGERASL